MESTPMFPIIKKKALENRRKLASPKKLPKVSISSKENTSLQSHYYYHIHSGNNSRALLQCLRKRPWWRSINENNSYSDFIWEMYKNPIRYTRKHRNVLLNHLWNNSCLVTKKGIFQSVRSFCRSNELSMSDYIPQTFFINSTIVDDQPDDLTDFLAHNENHKTLHDNQDDAIYILKPGALSNRGCGIVVVRGGEEILQLIGRSPTTTTMNTIDDTTPDIIELPETTTEVKQNSKKVLKSIKGWIVQCYMERPLLVGGRKFDIRCYGLLVYANHTLKGYIFADGYIRTSGKLYNLNKLSDRETHLTNDAVQQHAKSYGKYEAGNKLSYEEWGVCIARDYPHAPSDIVSQIISKIEDNMKLTFKSAQENIMNNNNHGVKRSFELMGYDYMVDENFHPYLIEINSNPCLEFACPLLERIISSLLENVFSLVVDAFCPPPTSSTTSKTTLDCITEIQSQQNKFKELSLQ